MNVSKKLVIGALCTALCVALPMAFHAVGKGSMFLPMHIPVLICGLVRGWPYGLVCGLLGPFLSSFTGMPPLAMLPGMMVECATYGAAAGLGMQIVRTGSMYADLYISMIAAMLLGRVFYGLVNAYILMSGQSLAAWAAASFVTALPGILIQLIVIPTLIVTLTRAKLIPAR